MNRFAKRGSFLFSVGVLTIMLAALALSVASSQAQAPTPANTTSLVRLTQVKPEMAPEFLTLQKNEVLPALKKAGITPGRSSKR